MPKNDVKQLFESLRILIDDEEMLRRKVSAINRRRALQLFDGRSIAKNMQRL
jgi:hypothetical protein